MAMLQTRRLGSWTWWSRFLGKSNQPVAKNDNVEEIAKPTIDEHLKCLTLTHMPQYAENWTYAPLKNANIKAMVLRSCEATFDQSISDQQLGSIHTMKDVLKALQHPKETREPSLFPNLDRHKELPPNLSVQIASLKPREKTSGRTPFQNYSSPEHAMFLNKQQKEARKQKRRHLTAFKLNASRFGVK